MRIIEIFAKGCLACDYIYRLQKRLGIYDKIEHIENTSKDAVKYNISVAPTFIILYNEKEVERFEAADREALEKIKSKYIDW